MPYSPANTIARTITVKNGTYTEYVHFRSGQNLVTLKGESQNGTVIQYLVNNFVLGDLPNQNTLDPRGVFSCSTNDVTLQNLTIKNLTPNGGSQAEALVHGGQRFIANHVSLYSYQDTLLAGGGTAFYTDSYIEGAVDYIWGGAQAFFLRCELKANTSSTYYTQARNSQGAKGYAFVNCTLDAYPSVSASASSLSRTFNDFSQTIYINCKIGPHVSPAGWSIVSGNTDTLQLWEYQNTDLNGAPLDVSQRPTFNHSFSVSGNSIVYTPGASSSPDVFDHQQVSAAMAALFSTPSAFYGSWSPMVAPTFDLQPTPTQTIEAGHAVTFTASASGFPDPTYQWQKNGVPISGATSSSYTIPFVSPGDAGTYAVVATNGAGSGTSNPATLSVTDTTSPTIAAPAGGFAPLTLTVGTSGTVPLPGYISQAVTSDNVGVTSVMQSPAAGTSVSAGSTSVTLTASDAAGNTASTSFNVTVLSSAQSWRQQYFGTTNNSGNAADTANPSGDGMVNLLKFAFGLNPLVSNSGSISVNSGAFTRGIPTTVATAGQGGVSMQAVFGRRKDAAASGLTYTAQFSADLQTWGNSTDIPTVVADDGEIEVVTVPYPSSINGQPARFFRVQVTGP